MNKFLVLCYFGLICTVPAALIKAGESDGVFAILDRAMTNRWPDGNLDACSKKLALVESTENIEYVLQYLKNRMIIIETKGGRCNRSFSLSVDDKIKVAGGSGIIPQFVLSISDQSLEIFATCLRILISYDEDPFSAVFFIVHHLRERFREIRPDDSVSMAEILNEVITLGRLFGFPEICNGAQKALFVRSKL
jgi:hypothetical protein